MVNVKRIPGIAWAADVMTGRKPIPTNKSKKIDPTFQRILDAEMERLENEQEHDRPDR